ncbi:hypothetical protein [Vagococcus xieshaowenii]|uniref:Uncharacterized protein n=1 Tax=Vagococcus xieshaowenii TaxID=2562451 RepID=A0AAJ5EDZ0_9ENTE|nr:hypothetical protein [Vagococcus xieshaowenii]QCA29167.1 hypothetical protein E4Z98_07505 [Vagococcus xieshaowenii]TFZ40855.1 hypothetical protein E4031_05585 [Vagococcus xieshaowenii]
MAYKTVKGQGIEKIVIEVSKLSGFMNELSSNIYKLVDKHKADVLAAIIDEMEYDLVNESEVHTLKIQKNA